MGSPPPPLPWRVALPALSVVVTCVALEIVLRLVPIPGIAYRSFYYDPVTGGKYYPHTMVTFQGDGGVEIRRRTNAWGFLDVEHARVPQSATLRIGFFGDSYTEAGQVPIDATFFRLIERDLNARLDRLGGARNRRGELVRHVEVLAFGVSGRSTLQSYLECLNWMARCDLDHVVYVFVENDPGDNLPRVKGSDQVPYPVLTTHSFAVDYSFNDRYGYKTSWWHRAFQFIKSNSLVVSTLESRLKLLAQRGVTSPWTNAAGDAAAGAPPMAPSSWPPELVPEGWTITERVLDRWRQDVEGEGRRFSVIRVPAEGQVNVPLAEQDSWAPRLHEHCARRGIALVDPTPFLLARMRGGEPIYDNHFSRAGHRAFADAFVTAFTASEAIPLAMHRPDRDRMR